MRYLVQRVAETGSTNADLLVAAREGAAEGTVLVADHQTAGRGRLGRRWEDRPGRALLVSVLLRPRLEPERLHLLTMAMAVAAARACADVAGVHPGLKWPNDLVLPDGKLAGLLAEGVVRGGAVEAVVVGLGLNLDPPEGVDAPVAALSPAAGRHVDRDELLAALLGRLDAELADLGGVRDRYLARSATVGTDVSVATAAGLVEGEAQGITAEGHLVVATADGVRTVREGDVTTWRRAPEGP